jgi:hypothetical protein
MSSPVEEEEFKSILDTFDYNEPEQMIRAVEHTSMLEMRRIRIDQQMMMREMRNLLERFEENTKPSSSGSTRTKKSRDSKKKDVKKDDTPSRFINRLKLDPSSDSEIEDEEITSDNVNDEDYDDDDGSSSSSSSNSGSKSSSSSSNKSKKSKKDATKRKEDFKRRQTIFGQPKSAVTPSKQKTQLLVLKSITRENFQFVPNLNLNENWTDEKMYCMYDLNQDEIEYIENSIRTMEIS